MPSRAMVSPAIDRLVEEIGAHPQVSRVWLFGSRARGDHRQRSDVDLAIEAPSADRRTWIALCDVAEEADTLLRIDLVRLDEAPPELADRIRREGMVLYDRVRGYVGAMERVFAALRDDSRS